jgi:hypothetical protein
MPALLVLRFSQLSTALLVEIKIMMKKVPLPAGFFFMPCGAGGFRLIPKGYEVSDLLLIGEGRATIENDCRVLFL